jgi:hypothetical protein
LRQSEECSQASDAACNRVWLDHIMLLYFSEVENAIRKGAVLTIMLPSATSATQYTPMLGTYRLRTQTTLLPYP